MVRDFDLEVMNFGQLGLLLVKGFQNEGELKHYRSLLSQDGGVKIPAGVRPVQISKSNFEKLLQGAGSFDDYFRFIGEETVRETHESVLPPEEYPPAEEMYVGMGQEEDTVSSESLPSVQSDKKEPFEKPLEPKQEPKQKAKTEPKQDPKRVSKPQNKEPEVPKKQQPKPQTPKLPDYPVGSEGDEE